MSTRQDATKAETQRSSLKFLTFYLGREQYGVDILKVQEIIGLLPATRVPHTRPYVKGLVNLRGKILPVVDLRLWFGLEAIPPTDESCVIFVRVRDVEMGLIVDRVSDVLEIPEDQIDHSHALGTDCLMGIGKVDDSAKLLLDVDRICVSG
ncbi:MAG: chemotaxis protein CheW [Acidobacteriota bacterium]